MGPVASAADLTRALGEQTKEEWRAMAAASGWSPDMQRRKALEAAFGSMFIRRRTGVS